MQILKHFRKNPTKQAKKQKKNLHFMIEKEKNDLAIPIIPSLTID